MNDLFNRLAGYLCQARKVALHRGHVLKEYVIVGRFEITSPNWISKKEGTYFEANLCGTFVYCACRLPKKHRNQVFCCVLGEQTGC